MSDMLNTITPKSDQLNADDLIGGRTLTITITRVTVSEDPQQPVTLNFHGDNGKPYKPCKSMRRVLVSAWGGDGNQYVGRSLTLYRDDSVKFGGAAVGGLRISHMSHLSEPLTVALTVSKANRKPYTVQPLKVAPAAPAGSLAAILAGYDACGSQDAFAALEAERSKLWSTLKDTEKRRLKAASEAASKRLAESPPVNQADNPDDYRPPEPGEMFAGGSKPAH